VAPNEGIRARQNRARVRIEMMITLARSRQFLEHVLPAVVRPLRVLWNQMIGFLFLVLAVWAIPRGVRSVREFSGDLESFFRLLLTGLFIAVMGGYGIYSFWRARKAARP
jgi:type VI protein secretion system component VasK